LTDAGRKVLAGFVRLSVPDRRAVIDEMNRFVEASAAERSRLANEHGQAVRGPVGSGCPCCGR
jgi:hypothetical protein